MADIPVTTPTKIVQIVMNPTGLIIGLGDDGILYYWNTNMNKWTEYKS